MTYDDALKYFGGTQVKLAAALGIDQSTVSYWGRVIPAAYQYQIEVLSNRKLRVDRELRYPGRRISRGRRNGDASRKPAL